MLLRKLIYITLVSIYVVTLTARLGFPLVFASEISNITLVELVNKERNRRDIHPLKYNKKLEAAAYKKAEDMFKKQYWAHFGPNQESPWQFMSGAGYSYTYAGENLAKGFSDSSAVHEAWMQSPSHKQNIMDPAFDEVGIAIVQGNLQGNSVFLVVQMFGSTELKSGAAPRTDYPKVKITSPEDGDILEDGAFTIKGQVNKVQNDQINLLINDEFLQSTRSSSGSFNYTLQAPLSYGDATLSAKATGINEEYLLDIVSVKILNPRTDQNVDLSSCVTKGSDSLNHTFTFTCDNTAQVTGMEIKAGSMVFTSDKSSSKVVNIPKGALPKEFQYYEIKVSFADGKNNYFKLPHEQDVLFTNSGLNIQTEGLFTVKNLIWAGVSILGGMIIIYALILMKRKQLTAHKNEIVLLIFASSIIVFTLVFGVVNV